MDIIPYGISHIVRKAIDDHQGYDTLLHIVAHNASDGARREAFHE